MWPIRNTCAILGLCLLSLLCNVAVAVAAAAAAPGGSLSPAEAYAALPSCAVRAPESDKRERKKTRDGKLTCFMDKNNSRELAWRPR